MLRAVPVPNDPIAEVRVSFPRSYVLRAALVALVLSAPASGAPAPAAPAPAVTLPDTGLFAPVAARYRARIERLAALPVSATADERMALLLAVGRTDDAAEMARGLAEDTPAVRAMLRRVLLARQDFEGVEALDARPKLPSRPGEAERSSRYAVRIAHDDAAAVDSLTRAAVARGDDASARPELLAAARLAYDQLRFGRADSLYARVLAVSPAAATPAWGDDDAARRAVALTGRALVQQKRREWDASLATLREALALDGSADALMALTETLIRLGRTDEAISAAEWAVRLAPYHDAAHYLLGNGYARRNYSQLVRAYPGAFADAAGRRALAAADARLGAGDREGARAAYGAVVTAHPGWVDALARLASLDFEDGRFAESRDGCFAALRVCPEYGRAHAILAKALEGQRFLVDVHRAAYEARFAAAPMPDVPGIERFVTNWKALSPRHQKRVALSIAPWRAFVPVLIEGGASYYIKPLWMRLSECPEQGTLRDQRIDYDSRLWDDVRGCGGFHTVTGIEDVERTIFDRYNTVLHEFTHQVHGVLPADDSRAIQERYVAAKARDDANHDGFLSRYAGGSVFEYFAEGANALASPMRDAYDPREVVRERLERIDPALRALVAGFQARTDVSASYPVAYSGGGDDRVEKGRVALAVPLYRKALALAPANETALLSLSRALELGGRSAEAESVAAAASVTLPASGAVRVRLAESAWHAGRSLASVRAALAASRALVRAEDRHDVDAERGRLALHAGDAPAALAAYDSLLAYQSDSPDGMRGRARALALAGRASEAFAEFDRAVRMRTGIADLRGDYASALLTMGRVAEARAQLDAAKLLDEQHPEAEALRAWADLAESHTASALAHAKQALAWAPACDLARIVLGAAQKAGGTPALARATWAPLDARIARDAPPAWTYRAALATWSEVHVLGAAERARLAAFRHR